MKKRIVLFVLSLALIIGMLSAGNAYAWFANLQGGSQDANLLQAGVIDYSVGTDTFILTSDDIYPEQNLVTGMVSLNNDSDIATKLRIKITYDYDGSTLAWDPTDDDSPLRVVLDDDTAWTFDSTDEYLYYNSTVAAGADVDLFDELCYSGPNTENDAIAGESVTITLLYEARQSDYLTSWTY